MKTQQLKQLLENETLASQLLTYITQHQLPTSADGCILYGQPKLRIYLNKQNWMVIRVLWTLAHQKVTQHAIWHVCNHLNCTNLEHLYTIDDAPPELFWKHVDRQTDDQCWPWLAGVDREGYGKSAYPGINSRRANIIAWQLANGQAVPDQMVVRHLCHNPRCCNPAHLAIGSSKDNSQDSVRSNRVAFGERHGRAKLTEKSVIAIYEDYHSGRLTQRQLAEKHQMRWETIRAIVNKTTWRRTTQGLNDNHIS